MVRRGGDDSDRAAVASDVPPLIVAPMQLITDATALHVNSPPGAAASEAGKGFTRGQGPAPSR